MLIKYTSFLQFTLENRLLFHLDVIVYFPLKSFYNSIIKG